MFLIFLLSVCILLCIISYSKLWHYKNHIKSTSWETLKFNHPELEILMRKHLNDKPFFQHLDHLMASEDFDAFYQNLDKFVQQYPDLQEHILSLNLSKNEMWRRFFGQRDIARVVFDSIKP
jgi:hypothetical protein